MTGARAPHACRVAVAAVEPLIGRDRYDYADAFEVGLHEGDGRSAEEFARCALEHAPALVREAVWIVHRYLLRARLGPRTSPDHVLGWRVTASQPDAVKLEATSPLLGRGVIVGRRPEPTRAVVTTYLFFDRPTRARVAWALAGPVHRRVAPYLLEQAAITNQADIAAAA